MQKSGVGEQKEIDKGYPPTQTPSGYQMVTKWCTSGPLLVYFWSTSGLLVVF